MDHQGIKGKNVFYDGEKGARKSLDPSDLSRFLDLPGSLRIEKHAENFSRDAFENVKPRATTIGPMIKQPHFQNVSFSSNIPGVNHSVMI